MLIIKIILILSFTIIFLNCIEKKSSETKTSPFDKESVIAKVIEVYDGDTFLASCESVQDKVRILNIDCFETSYGTRLEGQAKRSGISNDSALKLGLIAKKIADSLLRGKDVILNRDYYQPNRDVYNRLLRVVSINGMKYDSIIIALKLNAK